MPAYQTEAPASLHVINSASSGAPCGAAAGNCREVPDVSADADPNTGYVIYWNGSGSAGLLAPAGWQVVGGTSGAAPAWAALIALTNASSPCSGTAVGFANPALYNAAANAYAADFNDTTTGDNDMTSTNGGQFAAGPGYDMATGLGTPQRLGAGRRAVHRRDLAGQPGRAALARCTARSACRSRPPTPAAASVHFSATGLPAGLSMGPSNGKITGRPSHLGTPP